jgi:hypothetical protein
MLVMPLPLIMALFASNRIPRIRSLLFFSLSGVCILIGVSSIFSLFDYGRLLFSPSLNASVQSLLWLHFVINGVLLLGLALCIPLVLRMWSSIRRNQTKAETLAEPQMEMLPPLQQH